MPEKTGNGGRGDGTARSALKHCSFVRRLRPPYGQGVVASARDAVGGGDKNLILGDVRSRQMAVISSYRLLPTGLGVSPPRPNNEQACSVRARVARSFLTMGAMRPRTARRRP